MTWLSIDPSKACTGVAVWEGTELQRHFTIKPRGKKGAYYFGDEIVSCREVAFERLRFTPVPKDVYWEEGKGKFVNAAAAQGWMQGYLTAVFERSKITPRGVDVNEWRRVIKEDQGISWPANRDRKKELAINLAEALYGLSGLTDDEADAILLGRACQRMFNIK